LYKCDKICILDTFFCDSAEVGYRAALFGIIFY